MENIMSVISCKTETRDERSSKCRIHWWRPNRAPLWWCSRPCWGRTGWRPSGVCQWWSLSGGWTDSQQSPAATKGRRATFITASSSKPEEVSAQKRSNHLKADRSVVVRVESLKQEVGVHAGIWKQSKQIYETLLFCITILNPFFLFTAKNNLEELKT